MIAIYPACFFKEANGYSVVFPDLNGTSTCGSSLDEAMASAIDCLAGYLFACQQDGMPMPASSGISGVDAAAVARELEITPEESFVNLVAVDVAEYAKRHFTRAVKKTLTIPAWLNDAAQEQGVNFSQVLQEALKARLDAGHRT